MADENHPVVVILGQSLNPDGTAPQSLKSRLQTAVEFVVRLIGTEGQTKRVEETMSETEREREREEAKAESRSGEKKGERWRRLPVIFSGGDPAGTGKTEAEIMRGLFEREVELAGHLLLPLLLQQDVVLQHACLLIEDRMAQNTLQNAWYSLQILAEIEQKRACRATCLFLVSSDFHLPRSVYLFKALFHFCGRSDLKIIPIPAPTEDPASSSSFASSTFSSSSSSHEDAGQESEDHSEKTTKSTVSPINQMSKKERLELEKRLLTVSLVGILNYQIPGTRIPPLPQSDLDDAIAQVDLMLSSAKF